MHFWTICIEAYLWLLYIANIQSLLTAVTTVTKYNNPHTQFNYHISQALPIDLGDF